MKLALASLMTLVWIIAHIIAYRQTSKSLDKLTSSRNLQRFSVDLFNYFAITCSLAITAVTRISFLIKTILILSVILIQVILNASILSDVLSLSYLGPSARATSQLPSTRFDGGSLASDAAIDAPSNSTLAWSSRPESSSDLPGIALDGRADDGLEQFIFTFTLITICWTLFLINRQFELTNRRLFLWRKQVEQRKEKVADMRRKNEALVYNILPPNVAKIFLGKRTINDEELYSKSYDAVGVLFASMPNFSDFYTEESVNNQGLECLRFLNEVISDFDALLDQTRFKNIIKIKTMGSTYMAASGLYEGDALDEVSGLGETGSGGVAGVDSAAGAPISTAPPGPDESQTDGEQQISEAEVRAKWSHLEQLTEFALALKDTLNNINKESFNNFVLRVGINQGPITAGVIGVKKPHFDMWGNTVNVASRMESTGRAGSIQVVEGTANILRHFGFQFDQRGLVSVKGKGRLMTFYLTGREPLNGSRLQEPSLATTPTDMSTPKLDTIAISSSCASIQTRLLK